MISEISDEELNTRKYNRAHTRNPPSSSKSRPIINVCFNSAQVLDDSNKSAPAAAYRNHSHNHQHQNKSKKRRRGRRTRAESLISLQETPPFGEDYESYLP